MTWSMATLSSTTLSLMLLMLCLSSNIVPSQTRSMIKTLPGFSGDLPFYLETGYIGVGDLEQVQLFYYFIESEGSPKDDALFLWLTGGPGCSAFSGLVFEIGPLRFDYSNSSGKTPVFKLNPYSWTKVANIIFVDSPVGTGFSYAKSWTGLENDDTTQSALLYEFLRKSDDVTNRSSKRKRLREWLSSHPQFLNNPLYMTGDSYSGKIIPMLVEEIYNGNEAGREPAMNLRGYVMGNPVTFEAKDIGMRVPYAHLVGLISDEIYQSAKGACKGDYANVDPSNIACLNALQNVSICIDKIYLAHILEPICNLLSPKSDRTTRLWNRSMVEEDRVVELISPTPRSLSKQWCRSYNYLYSYIWANDENVQRALHIREGTLEEWVRCNWSMSYTKDVLTSVPYNYNLTKKSLRVLVYSGDHDLAIPYIGTIEWIKSLNLTVLGGWAPWFVNGQIAGYSTLYGNYKYDLTYTTIKGGGHTAPEYRPEQCLAMIERWLAYYPL